MLPAIVIALVLAAGSRGTAPPQRSTDMDSVPYSNDVPSPNHLGHWHAPAHGSILFLSANSLATGVNNPAGTNLVTLGLLVEGQGTVCELTLPCTLAPGDQIQKVTCGATFAADDEVHIEFSHTCLTAPTGTLTMGFSYER